MKKNIVFKLFILSIVFLFNLSCKKSKTSWDSDWVVPLVNDSLVIKNHVNDSTFAINSDNSIQVIARRTIFKLDLSEMIKIPDTNFLQTHTISIPSLQVLPGSTFIDDVKDYDLSVEDVVLTEARIKKGNIKIEIENPVNTKGFFTIYLPGVTKNGVEFSESGTLAAGTTGNPGKGTINIDFSGYTIDLSGKDGDKYNLLQTKLSVMSDPKGEAVTITQLDKFNTNISFENLSFDYGKGYFGNKVFSGEEEIKVDFLEKIISGNINTEEIELDLIVKNGIVANGQAEINTFESIHHSGTTVSLQHPHLEQVLNIDPAKGAWENLQPSKKVIRFDATNGNLSDFIENLGGKYKIDYSFQLNPWGNTSNGHNIVYPKSTIDIDFQANFPFKLGADKLILLDTFDLDFANDNNVLLLKSGKLILKTTNSFPYGADIKLTLLDENLEPLKDINSVGKISPAQTDNTIFQHIPIEEEIEYLIDEATAEILSEAKYIKILAEFNSTQFNDNVVYDNAALRFILLGQFTLHSKL